MKNEFIPTQNVGFFNDLCAELESPDLIGPSLAAVMGPAGRGKSEAAKRYAIHSTAVYIPPLNIRTPTMMLREICFDLAGVRPGRAEACLTQIGEALGRERRVVIIDEADLLAMPVLEMLRNLNERFGCPIVLIGEDELKTRLAGRRRLTSRLRRRLAFGPVTRADVALFFQRALDLTLSSEVAGIVHRHSGGDWRPVLTAAISIERALTASGLAEVGPDLAREVTRDPDQNA